MWVLAALGLLLGAFLVIFGSLGREYRRRARLIEVTSETPIAEARAGELVAIVGHAVPDEERPIRISVMASGVDGWIEATVVRAVAPRASDAQLGRGISAQLSCVLDQCDPAARSLVAAPSIAEVLGFNVHAGVERLVACASRATTSR